MGQKKVRVAVIGCGAITKSMHLPVLTGHEDIELTTLVDRDLSRATELARAYNVAHVLADTKQLSAQQVDAAIIATPPFHHAPCTVDLLSRGLHVLVEKPMATRLSDAEDMVRVARESGRILSVGFFRRLNPSIRLLQALLEKQWAGRALRFRVEGGGMYNWAAATLGNMKREQAGGGVLIDFGSHMIDLMFALFQEPANVLEYRDDSIGGIEADCTIRTRVQHQGRPIEGIIELARTRELGNLIRVECERATLQFHVQERHRIQIIPKDLELRDPASGRIAPFWFQAGWQNVEENESWYETFRAQIDDWVVAIRESRQPILSGESALPTARFIDACYQQRQPMPQPWVWLGIAPDPAETTSPTSTARPLFQEGKGCSPRRILVTGASGFIGSRVAEILRMRENCQVRALVHNPGNASRLARLDVELVQGSLDSEADVQEAVKECDAVIHCAIGTEWGQRRRIFEVTVEGTKRLAKAALAAGAKRFVHLSTISIFGDDSTMQGTLDESTPIRPSSGDYGESKALAEKMVLKMVSDGLDAIVLRPARVFGPFSRIFITRPLQALAENRFRWIGSPDVPCDMVYVDNLVQAILLSVSAPADKVRGEIFNISDGDEMTWREFYSYFGGALHLKLDKVTSRTAGAEADPSLPIRAITFPFRFVGSIGEVIKSSEFKALGRKVLQTDPLGTIPRWLLQRIPLLERGARRLVGANNSLPIHQRETPHGSDLVEMGSGGALVNITKANKILGYAPPVSRAEALAQTLAWVRHARLVNRVNNSE